MREIKFRAWDIIDENMYESSGVRNDGMPADFTSEEEVDIEPSWVLQQYTGLKDINLKDIYEGDIVTFVCGNPNCVAVHKTNIIWINDLACWGFIQDGQEYPLQMLNSERGIGLLQIRKVIGNIHENPELLESK